MDSTASIYSPSGLLSGTMKSRPQTQPQSFWQAQEQILVSNQQLHEFFFCNPRNKEVFLSETGCILFTKKKRICQTFTVPVTFTQIFPVPKDSLRQSVPWEPRKLVEDAYSSITCLFCLFQKQILLCDSQQILLALLWPPSAPCQDWSH